MRKFRLDFANSVNGLDQRIYKFLLMNPRQSHMLRNLRKKTDTSFIGHLNVYS